MDLNNKTELRHQALKKRKQLAKQGLLGKSNKKIVEFILNSTDFKNSNNIGLYYPIFGEVNLLDLLKEVNKNFYFPKCKSDKLEFVKYNGFSEHDFYNIPCPIGDAINPSILDVIYVPALIANTRKYRLGYGKGCYDKFFTENKINAKKILVLSDLFISDEFEEDSYDVLYDEIISD